MLTILPPPILAEKLHPNDTFKKIQLVSLYLLLSLCKTSVKLLYTVQSLKLILHNQTLASELTEILYHMMYTHFSTP